MQFSGADPACLGGVFLLRSLAPLRNGYSADSPVVRINFVNDYHGGFGVLVQNVHEHLCGAFDKLVLLLLRNAFLCYLDIYIRHIDLLLYIKHPARSIRIAAAQSMDAAIREYEKLPVFSADQPAAAGPMTCPMLNATVTSPMA